MPYASARIAVRFASLLRDLEPDAGSLNRARVRAASVGSRLREVFTVVRVQVVGSVTKRTAIHGASDIDLFIVLSRASVRWGDSLVSSDTLLDNVRTELQQRYPRSPIYRDRMAVSVSLDSGHSVIDVVPAVFKGPHPTAGLCFEMPDGYGGWMTTAPDRHLTSFRAADVASRGKLRRVIQLLKHWRYSRQQPIPLSSFHAELVLASTRVCVGPSSYSRALSESLSVLLQRQGTAVRDPLGVSGLVHAASTEAQRASLVRGLEHASYNAELAIEAESSDRVSDAIYRWQQVFNGGFAS